MKKPNSTAIIFRFWQWGAMHSPHFNRFIFELEAARLNLMLCLPKWAHELRIIRLSFVFPTGVATNAPHAAIQEFINYMKIQGIEVDHSIIDGIPF
ncbi:hypothetical protein HUN01_06860 [Nostoc edaphicum CCNP1411]|uniref:Uncharacterized protein n=1 Tax=Nostoc edaphicum CCNP1411 TaxID=1472755 RepID=A0A7D7L954_9NOSO|nr:hypothetical protein [Nostoc edaphicum]QMS87316.1 hypothetical protein HUN01_06860 [Nostoc edaphicum CCNP1411]